MVMRAVAFLLFLGTAWCARAVIVQGGDGTQNATSAGAGRGWDYVGAVNGASGVYLGEYGGSSWVLTAAHVGEPLAFTLAGTTYDVVAGSSVSLAGGVDLQLFRIDGNPGLAPIGLSLATPAAGTTVTMIGYGMDRATTETFWRADWTETSNPVLGVHKGYKWTGSGTKRWGTNTVAGTVVEGATTYFTTTFDRTAGQAQAALGDSGGGVFTWNGATWELAGIMGLVTNFAGQPAATSVYGSATYSADVATYREEILDIVSAPAVPVPEPATRALLLGGAALLAAGAVWRRRR